MVVDQLALVQELQENLAVLLLLSWDTAHLWLITVTSSQSLPPQCAMGCREMMNVMMKYFDLKTDVKILSNYKDSLGSCAKMMSPHW